MLQEKSSDELHQGFNNQQNFKLDGDLKSDIRNLICFNFYVGWREIVGMYKDVYGNNVSPQNIFILNYCAENSDVKIGDIATHLDLAPSPTSTLISRMESAGWLRREHGESDRRTIFVKLTEEGRQYQQSIQEQTDALTDTISDGLTAEQTDTLISIVNRLKINRTK